MFKLSIVFVSFMCLFIADAFPQKNEAIVDFSTPRQLKVVYQGRTSAYNLSSTQNFDLGGLGTARFSSGGELTELHLSKKNTVFQLIGHIQTAVFDCQAAGLTIKENSSLEITQQGSAQISGSFRNYGQLTLKNGTYQVNKQFFNAPNMLTTLQENVCLKYFDINNVGQIIANANAAIRHVRNVMSLGTLFINGSVTYMLNQGVHYAALSQHISAWNKTKAPIVRIESYYVGSDGVKRRKDPMPMTDNACGFYAITWDDLEDKQTSPRQEVCGKLLKQLLSDEKICKLIAPDILEGIKTKQLTCEAFNEPLVSFYKLEKGSRDASLEAKKFVQALNGLTPRETYLSLPEGAKGKEELGKVLEAEDGKLNELLQLASNQSLVKSYINKALKQENYMLTYMVGEGGRSTGVMDAIAYMYHKRFVIYQARDGNVLEQYHKTPDDFPAHWPLLEILHVNNIHFDRLVWIES